MIDIGKYYPKIYESVLEIDVLKNVENELLQIVEDEIKRIDDNQFIIRADEKTISAWEGILNIVNNSSDLEFRRQRVISRLSDSVPYTLNALKLKLDSMIGEDAYNIFVDNNTFTIFLESALRDQGWIHEVQVTIHKYKPCNMIFVTKPTITENLLINEEVSLNTREYNYKLNGSWFLGQRPFMSLVDRGVVKMKGARSIESELINELKRTTLNKINHIIINDTYRIDNFKVKDIVDDKVVIEYVVPVSSSLDNITKVQIFDSNSKVLSTITLYVPLLNDSELKHTINIEEGVKA